MENPVMSASPSPSQNPIPPKSPKDPAVDKAVAAGKASIAQGKSKVDATRVMFPLVEHLPREVIWQTFQEGASLTERGAITYHYNRIREKKRVIEKKDA